MGSTNSNRLGAANRNGTLITSGSGTTVSLVDSSFNSVELFGGLTGGFGFSPVSDILFAVDVVTDEVIALNTNTFAEIER